jgi:glucosamine-6-phosphate deaminase
MKGKSMVTPQILDTTVDQLRVSVYPTNQELGRAAAQSASLILQNAIAEKGSANVILAAANSQLSFLDGLKALSDVDWSKVNFFHMDEYIGLEPGHPASFALFLRRNFIDGIHPKAFYTIPSQEQDLDEVCRGYEQLLHEHPADLCAMGIGENGHVAFNDPPYADFADPLWVKVVQIDAISRRQQVNEGHFPSIEQVPVHAITLTIPALLAARSILVMVPETRKAEAVYNSLYGPIVDTCPASILRHAPHARLLLDRESAAKSFSI